MKTKEEFNLSEKERYLGTGLSIDDCIFKKKDVKEFIRLLKRLSPKLSWIDNSINFQEEIDKLAGDKLK